MQTINGQFIWCTVHSRMRAITVTSMFAEMSVGVMHSWYHKHSSTHNKCYFCLVTLNTRMALPCNHRHVTPWHSSHRNMFVAKQTHTPFDSLMATWNSTALQRVMMHLMCSALPCLSAHRCRSTSSATHILWQLAWLHDRTERIQICMRHSFLCL